MPSGKKRKRHKMSTHKRKKRLRKNRHKKKISKLSIMDNKVIKIIFFNPLMIFKKNDNNSLPFNRLSGIKLQEINNEYPNYIHLEILNFINLFESSISKKLPFSFKFSYQLTSRLSKCIGVMTLFLPD